MCPGTVTLTDASGGSNHNARFSATDGGTPSTAAWDADTYTLTFFVRIALDVFEPSMFSIDMLADVAKQTSVNVSISAGGARVIPEMLMTKDSAGVVRAIPGAVAGDAEPLLVCRCGWVICGCGCAGVCVCACATPTHTSCNLLTYTD